MPYDSRIRRWPSAVPPPWLPMAGTMNGSAPSRRRCTTAARKMIGHVGNASTARRDGHAVSGPHAVGQIERRERRFDGGRHIGHTRPRKSLTKTKHTRVFGHGQHCRSAAAPRSFHSGQDDIIQPVLLEHPHEVEELFHVDGLDDVPIDLERIALQLVLVVRRGRHDHHRDILQARVRTSLR